MGDLHAPNTSARALLTAGWQGSQSRTATEHASSHVLQEMASRHRVRYSSLSIIKTATVPPALCKRDGTKQFHNSKISFPLTQKLARCVLPPCQDCGDRACIASVAMSAPLTLDAVGMLRRGRGHRRSDALASHAGTLDAVILDINKGTGCLSHSECCWRRPSSRTYKTVFKAVRPTVAVF